MPRRFLFPSPPTPVEQQQWPCSPGGWPTRVSIRVIAAGSYVGLATAIGLMLVGQNEFFLFVSTITFGLSVGAGMIVQSYIFAAYFGRMFLGSIRGIVLPVMLISAGMGAPWVRYIRDSTGSYITPWWLILSIYLVAALIISSATRPVSNVPESARPPSPSFNPLAIGYTMFAA